MPILKDSIFSAVQPDPNITVSEWADQFRVLTSKSSAESGLWRTNRTPYLREIMDTLSPQNETQKVVFMKPSQCGGSEVGFNWLGYCIHLCPAPFMSVQPTEVLAEKISKQRIAPMIEASQVLTNLISPPRERDSGNTLFVKEFRGGMFAMVGANSAVGLRSMPIRFAHLTEVSAYPADVGGEGDPVSLVEKRQETFSYRKKIYLESTPGLKDTCRIEAEYLESDQRKYFVPCPHCKHMQTLEWKNLKWDDGNPNTAEYQCENCSALIEEHHKSTMLKDRKAGGKAEWRKTNPESDVAGFYLNALYSPLGWKSWASIVKEFLKVRADAPRLKTFINTVLAQTWEEDFGQVGSLTTQERAENYPANIAPEGTLVVTAGVDVQDDRLEITIKGWGVGEESWVISHDRIYGDPISASLWKQLDEFILKPVKHARGVEIPISATAIDSGGHYTAAVYQYARERRLNNVIAVKGQSQKNKPPIGKPTVVDINYKGQTLKNGAKVYPMGSDTIKHVLFQRLKHNEAGQEGYIHFHNQLELDYFAQLTSERLTTRYVKGFPIKEWTLKKGQRNEALDCWVMAYAALQWLYTRHNRKTFYEQFTIKLNALKPGEVKKELNPPLSKTDKVSNIGRISPHLRKGFVTKW